MINMERFIFQIFENEVQFNEEAIYVRATEMDIETRMYAGGFLRFLSSCYDISRNYPRGSKIDGQKILTLSQFDQWRREHHC